MDGRTVPYDELDMIFLDVGNTLVSMDYEWIRRELSKRGHRFSLMAVRRAEAAARPAVSRVVSGAASTEGNDVFTFYLKTMIRALIEEIDDDGASRLAKELVPVFRGPGRERLWSYVLPRVPEALSSLRSLGLRLAVVSNSDGTVEKVLSQCGLRESLEEVFDSHIVGFEKPDSRFFLHALESTGARPERTLHIGDLYSADVEGARSAGLHAALVDPFDDWPDVDCPRFEDLVSLSETVREHRSA